jgi:membrane protein DedA with SNARE-associated domain
VPLFTLLVLIGWIIQAATGLTMLAKSPHRRQALRHVIPALTALALFVVFASTEQLLWVWLAFAVVTVANVFGDLLLVARGRRLTGETGSFGSDYNAAIGAVFKGKFPIIVTFHALFSGVVFFATLALAVTRSLS